MLDWLSDALEIPVNFAFGDSCAWAAAGLLPWLKVAVFLVRAIGAFGSISEFF